MRGTLSLPYQFQRPAKERLELGGRAGGHGLADRDLGGRTLATEIGSADSTSCSIAVTATETAVFGEGASPRASSLSRSSSTMRSAVFLPMPGMRTSF